MLGLLLRRLSQTGRGLIQAAGVLRFEDIDEHAIAQIAAIICSACRGDERQTAARRCLPVIRMLKLKSRHLKARHSSRGQSRRRGNCAFPFWVPLWAFSPGFGFGFGAGIASKVFLAFSNSGESTLGFGGSGPIFLNFGIHLRDAVIRNRMVTEELLHRGTLVLLCELIEELRHRARSVASVIEDLCPHQVGLAFRFSRILQESHVCCQHTAQRGGCPTLLFPRSPPSTPVNASNQLTFAA